MCIWKTKNSCLLIDTITGSVWKIGDEFCQNVCGETDEAKLGMLKKYRIELENIPKTVEELEAKIKCGEIKTKPIEKPTPPEPIYTEPVTELPGLFAMARSAAGSAVGVALKAIIDHRVWCGRQQKGERQERCLACEHREIVKEHERCVSFRGGEQGCGCFLEQKRKLAGVRCDLGHWDEIDAKFDVPIGSAEPDTQAPSVGG